ncbi:MAG: kynureninase [Pseudomonadota bacterium]|mgnify:CR=1 FL=1|uniref:kynureninase n=1 Tax=unclassified Phenylobacterium TaxID=2640670 RepID=UPI0007012613|nr:MULTISPECIES: kynureninase [unclassified Phenylobacterium]KRB40047.1 kynureninase [Phenylobacterium sp. Root700]MBT9469699.1 kynureninase [Phenylobacterium sp.]
MLTRDDCLKLDQDDPLAGRRALFALNEGQIYLDGNSLGALPRNVGPRLEAAVRDEWGRDLITSWNTADWIRLPSRVGARIAPLIGAQADEVIAADSTSVNLFKLAAGALKLRPGRKVIVTEPGNFPTDLYILQGLRDLLGDIELRVVEPSRLHEALDEGVALLLLTHVHYKTGRLHDMAALTARAHEVGALALWDLSHSAGALAVDLNGCDADLAVGCGYKYLNGGPGAPAFLFVARRLHAEFRSPLTGWMGHAAPFAFNDDYAPAAGVLRGLCGTPSVLGLTALEASLEAFDGVDMGQVRAKSMALGDLFLDLALERCEGFELGCPRDAAQRGSQAALIHQHGYPIMQAMIHHGVIGDFRAPDVLRFGFTPLYVRYVDVWDAVDRLAAIMATGEWRQARFNEISAVT